MNDAGLATHFCIAVVKERGGVRCLEQLVPRQLGASGAGIGIQLSHRCGKYFRHVM